jgi:phospholipase B1
LNGAQSGGLAMNLDYELDYLIPRMYAYVIHDCIYLHIFILFLGMKSLISKSDIQNVWKMVTIQIGSKSNICNCYLFLLKPSISFVGNDQCASCGADYASNVTADAYSGYVEAAIERIKANMPKTVVNLRKF